MSMPLEPAMDRTRARHYPETGAGGFSRVDGTVQFFSRVQALLQPGDIILEFGAGRGAELREDPVPFRRSLRSLRGRAGRVIGVDVDPAVLTNPFLDEAHVIEPNDRLPLADASVDIIVSDHVFEHVTDAAHVARELGRVLRPGGWICARTPNRWSYVGLGINLIPNRLHARLLQALQPGRKALDVFPTRYRLNSFGALTRNFPPGSFEHHSYGCDAEPVYVGAVSPAWWLMRAVHRFSPRAWRGVLFVFIRKVG